MVVVERTRAESARSVELSAARRAVTTAGWAVTLPDALPPRSVSPEASEEMQPAAPASAATTAIATVPRDTVVPLIRPHPHEIAVLAR
ncbi:hypothetical protein [Streptomyces sp. NPDC094149]|uniref:hypothetical protein n=1 Tax=Streptomyces sp. NPDC094149 TaxID=3155079 RepID=UPI00333295D9